MDTKEDGGGEPSMPPTRDEAFLMRWSGEGLPAVRRALLEGRWLDAVRSADTFGKGPDDTPSLNRLAALLADEGAEMTSDARRVLADLLERHRLRLLRDREPLWRSTPAGRADRPWLVAIEEADCYGRAEGRAVEPKRIVAMLADPDLEISFAVRLALADLLIRHELARLPWKPRTPIYAHTEYDRALAEAVGWLRHFQRRPITRPMSFDAVLARRFRSGRGRLDVTPTPGGQGIVLEPWPSGTRPSKVGELPTTREAIWASQMMEGAVTPNQIDEATRKGGPEKTFRPLMKSLARAHERMWRRARPSDQG